MLGLNCYCPTVGGALWARPYGSMTLNVCEENFGTNKLYSREPAACLHREFSHVVQLFHSYKLTI